MRSRTSRTSVRARTVANEAVETQGQGEGSIERPFKGME